MTTPRLPMHRIREIVRRKWNLGRTHREIARSVGCSVGAVWKVVDRATAAGLDLAAVEALDGRELKARVHGVRVEPPTTKLHAATTVDGRDRRRLERVCRYLLRPAFAQDAVVALPDGDVRVHFKRPTRAG